jgi:phage terminase large subunit-like protein
MLRIVVAVDPSGADDEENIDNDEIGIVVCGLGIDGNGYVLEDLTCKCGPATWGRVVVNAFNRHGADRVVGEINFGGAMVGHVIKSAANALKTVVPFRCITASRGKQPRIEPASALCEDGKIRMAGIFRDLEDELCSFTTHGYTGDHSPNHADAFAWGMADLFPELMKHDDKPREIPQQIVHGRRGSETAWMRV